MGQDPGTGRAAVTETQDPGQIQREIEQTREQLGDNVAALAQKADVKAQARRKLDDTKVAVSEKKEQLPGKAREVSPDAALAAASQASHKARQNPVAFAVAAAFTAGFLTARALRHWRGRRER